MKKNSEPSTCSVSPPTSLVSQSLSFYSTKGANQPIKYTSCNVLILGKISDDFKAAEIFDAEEEEFSLLIRKSEKPDIKYNVTNLLNKKTADKKVKNTLKNANIILLFATDLKDIPHAHLQPKYISEFTAIGLINANYEEIISDKLKKIISHIHFTLTNNASKLHLIENPLKELTKTKLLDLIKKLYSIHSESKHTLNGRHLGAGHA